MADHPQYEIETIEDLLKVPADRRAACLAELPRILDYMAAVRNFIDACSPAKAGTKAKGFTWIDDGEAKIRSVTINAGDEPFLEMVIRHKSDVKPV